MSLTEAAQEGAQGGRGLDHPAQDFGGTATAQRTSIVDAVAADQGRGHQCQQLVAGVVPSGRVTRIEVPLNRLTQTQAEGRGGGQQQSCIGHQAVIIKCDIDAVGALK